MSDLFSQPSLTLSCHATSWPALWASGKAKRLISLTETCHNSSVAPVHVETWCLMHLSLLSHSNRHHLGSNTLQCISESLFLRSTECLFCARHHAVGFIVLFSHPQNNHATEHIPTFSSRRWSHRKVKWLDQCPSTQKMKSKDLKWGLCWL